DGVAGCHPASGCRRRIVPGPGADEEALRRSPGRLVVSEDAGEDDRRGGGDPRGGSWNGSVSAFRRVSALRRRTALRRGCPACLAGSGSERGPEQIEIVATGLRIEIK